MPVSRPPDSWDPDDDPFPSERPTLIEIVDRVSTPELGTGIRNRALLTILTGPERGHVFQVTGVEVSLGRSNEADITIADMSLSRVHARLSSSKGGFILSDAGSTNGTFVEDERLTGPMRLMPGARFRLGLRTTVALSLHDELEEAAALSVHEAAMRDRLTGAYNRGVFDDRLKSEMAFARRHNTELSVILFDVDHFKTFNDAHGHLLGDQVLRSVAAAVQDTVRTEDIFARYGGEEFVVIARSTPSDKARILGERIRSAIENTNVHSGDEPLTVTVSVGVSTYPSQDEEGDGTALVKAADGALYRAKRGGRNQVVHASDR